MPWSRSSVPVGAEREKYQKICWVRESAPEREVVAKIKALFSWGPSHQVKFYYACGRHLREATLQDVENANSWDCAAVRALMGSGSLYVCKESYVISSSSSSSDEEIKPKVMYGIGIFLKQEVKAWNVHCFGARVNNLLRTGSSHNTPNQVRIFNLWTGDR
jgi:hypothetical protein